MVSRCCNNKQLYLNVPYASCISEIIAKLSTVGYVLVLIRDFIQDGSTFNNRKNSALC